MSIETIKERADAATPGPWDWEDPYRLEQPLGFGMVVTYIDQFESKPSPADRTFIAHARQDIPALLRVAEAADWLLGEQDCPATSGGTEGKWCLNHDTPMVDDRCEMVATLARALAELDALP